MPARRRARGVATVVTAPADPCGAVQALLPRLARVCGVRALQAWPTGEGGAHRVWWLGERGAEPLWVLKLGARPREALVLRALAVALPGERRAAPDFIAPRVVGFWPHADRGRGVLCTWRAPGRSLQRACRSGASLPLAAWCRALGAVTAVPLTGPVAAALGWPARRSPVAVALERLVPWRDAAVVVPVDVAPLLEHAWGLLGRLAAAAAHGPVRDRWVFCHGDWSPANAVAPANAMAPGGGATAGDPPLTVVDWEHAHLGDVGEDAALAARSLFALGWSARAAVGAAQALAGPEARPDRLAFWLVAQAVDALCGALAAEQRQQELGPRVRVTGGRSPRPVAGPRPVAPGPLAGVREVAGSGALAGPGVPPLTRTPDVTAVSAGAGVGPETRVAATAGLAAVAREHGGTKVAAVPGPPRPSGDPAPPVRPGGPAVPAVRGAAGGEVAPGAPGPAMAPAATHPPSAATAFDVPCATPWPTGATMSGGAAGIGPPVEAWAGYLAGVLSSWAGLRA